MKDYITIKNHQLRLDHIVTVELEKVEGQGIVYVLNILYECGKSYSFLKLQIDKDISQGDSTKILDFFNEQSDLIIF